MLTLIPAALTVDARERIRAALGAVLGILLAGFVVHWCADELGASTWLVAPMGASAVLLFALPSSPLAQPWPVIGGSTLSALIGIGVGRVVPDVHVAAALAVGAAIGAMFLLRCLHPPGGAAALLMVMTHTADPKFAFLPVMLDAVVLVLAGAAYNRLTRRRYPHTATPPAPAAPGARFTAADLDAALAHYNEVVAVDRDDLEALLHEAETHAYRRTLGELRCAEIMSRDLVTVNANDSMAEAWRLLHKHSIKALPVVDGPRQIVGIVTLADFVRRLAPGSAGTAEAALQGRVGDVMSRQVRVAADSHRVVELLPLFSEGGHHHLPVVNAERALVGMITQSDVVRALHRSVS